MIKRRQAPSSSSCFVANEKGRIQQVVARHHLLPFSLVVEHDDKQGLVIIFSFRRRQRALAYHCLLVFCASHVDDDDELRAHYCQFFFSACKR
jgi:hypothetical protein